MKRQARGLFAMAVLVAVYAASAAPGVLAPYDPFEQHREFAFVPPARVHVVDASGAWRRPFVYQWVPTTDDSDSYVEDRRQAYPIRFLVNGRLFGVDAPGRVFLSGTDEYGRDLLSRLIHGAGTSLAGGLLAAVVAVATGFIVGGLAGFYGGVGEHVLMRLTELVMTVPWIYLLLALRAALPLYLEPTDAFLLLVVVVGAVAWARPARLVHGVVLSARTREFALAARSFGASDSYVLFRHVLPQAAGVALTQLAILAPQCTLAEVTMSFFGLGVGEPVPSWGNMLAGAQRYHVLTSYWWMFTPGIALAAVFLLYYALTDALHHRLATSPSFPS
jgi:peptide/nickel transport system permease protein